MEAARELGLEERVIKRDLGELLHVLLDSIVRLLSLLRTARSSLQKATRSLCCCSKPTLSAVQSSFKSVSLADEWCDRVTMVRVSSRSPASSLTAARRVLRAEVCLVASSPS